MHLSKSSGYIEQKGLKEGCRMISEEPMAELLPTSTTSQVTIIVAELRGTGLEMVRVSSSDSTNNQGCHFCG
jgi:hypothetical protein